MRKKSGLFWGLILLSAFLLGGCARDTGDKPAESGSGSGQTSASVSEEEPSVEPVRFEGTDLEGNALSSDIFAQSKLTMINVWATYCGPCLREMPSLGELAAEYDADQFQLIGIVSDVLEGGDQALAESQVRETGANYPHLLLNESIYYALLTDVSAVPTTFFLDGDGNILGMVVGAMEKSAWEDRINGLLETL